jgi:hypothetical protein
MSGFVLMLLAQAALKGSAVCIAALLACLLLRRAVPTVRHLLWQAAILSFIAAPLLAPHCRGLARFPVLWRLLKGPQPPCFCGSTGKMASWRSGHAA